MKYQGLIIILNIRVLFIILIIVLYGDQLIQVYLSLFHTIPSAKNLDKYKYI